MLDFLFCLFAFLYFWGGQSWPSAEASWLQFPSLFPLPFHFPSLSPTLQGRVLSVASQGHSTPATAACCPLPFPLLLLATWVKEPKGRRHQDSVLFSLTLASSFPLALRAALQTDSENRISCLRREHTWALSTGQGALPLAPLSAPPHGARSHRAKRTFPLEAHALPSGTPSGHWFPCPCSKAPSLPMGPAWASCWGFLLRTDRGSQYAHPRTQGVFKRVLFAGSVNGAWWAGWASAVRTDDVHCAGQSWT